MSLDLAGSQLVIRCLGPLERARCPVVTCNALKYYPLVLPKCWVSTVSVSEEVLA